MLFERLFGPRNPAPKAPPPPEGGPKRRDLLWLDGRVFSFTSVGATCQASRLDPDPIETAKVRQTDVTLNQADLEWNLVPGHWTLPGRIGELPRELAEATIRQQLGEG